MRVNEEKEYWNKAAGDPDVDKKYICDVLDDAFLKILGNPKGKVLEIGCGVGRLMKDGYYGIDISHEMIDIAKKRKPNCHFKVNDGRTIPYSDNFFDFVYCVLVFQHIPLDAVLGYVEEVRRVLKTGGMFIFQYIEGNEDEPFSKHHYLSPSGFFLKKKKGLIHPQWTWLFCEKYED